jgi:ATP-dependent exoDNAse (exonuclease V) beta subunit
MNLERGGWAHEDAQDMRAHQHEQQMGVRDQMHERVMGQQAQQFEAQQGMQDRQADLANAQQDRQHESAMGEREQAIESQREERGRVHEEQMTERSQQHERVMGQQQARAKIQEVKARPQPQRASSTSSTRQKRASGGSVHDAIETPYGHARRAPDGEFYVQHPHTGQYFRIRRRS